MAKSTQQSVLFPHLAAKPVIATFDTDGQSSDGGVLLLRSLDHGLQLTEALAKHLVDPRAPGRVTHSYVDLFRQRIFGIALGYSDCNDAQRVASDPCMKLACGRAPRERTQDLGSQPTLSRFENAQKPRAVINATRELERHTIHRLAKRHRRAKLVTLDFDPSCDPTYGQQEFSFFHGKYDTFCFLPQFGMLSFDDDAEQYLFHARLRPGNARCHRGVIPTLRRTVAELRKRLPKATIRVRLDGGFASPSLLDALEELGVQYVVGMPSNAALKRLAEPALKRARKESKRSEESERVFGELTYRTRSWRRDRRVVYKAEVVRFERRAPRDNLRLVVTNLRHEPESVYDIYRGRGDAENRIKEVQELDSDRTSCTRFVANQLRLLMSATAYVLYQELRWRLRRSEARRAQVGRLRLMLMKVGARVVASVRRVVVHFAMDHPWANLWVRAARSVGAVAAIQ